MRDNSGIFSSLETFFMLGKLVDFLIKRTTLSRVDSKTSDKTKEPTHLFLLARSFVPKREIEGAKKLLCCDVDSNYTPPCKLFFSLQWQIQLRFSLANQKWLCHNRCLERKLSRILIKKKMIIIKIGLQTDKNLGKLEFDTLIFCLNFWQIWPPRHGV